MVVRAGAGYWSMDAPTLVLGGATAGDSVWVRWPGGREVTVSLVAPPGTTRISAGGAAAEAPTSSR